MGESLIWQPAIYLANKFSLPIRPITPNRIYIRLAVLPQCTGQTDRQTDGQTHRLTDGWKERWIAIGRFSSIESSAA